MIANVADARSEPYVCCNSPVSITAVRLDWLIVCAATQADDGSWAIDCVVQQLHVPSLPYRHRRLAVAAQVLNWDKHDDQPTAFLTGPDDVPLAVGGPTMVTVAGGADRADTAAFLFDDVTFAAPGRHKATIVIEGVPFASGAFDVALCRG